MRTVSHSEELWGVKSHSKRSRNIESHSLHGYGMNLCREMVRFKAVLFAGAHMFCMKNSGSSNFTVFHVHKISMRIRYGTQGLLFP